MPKLVSQGLADPMRVLRGEGLFVGGHLGWAGADLGRGGADR